MAERMIEGAGKRGGPQRASLPCDDSLEQLSKAGELKTRTLFMHPWFGAMNAFQWLALASMHMGIHRKQVAAIISGLAS